MEDPFAGIQLGFTELQAQLPPQLPPPAQADHQLLPLPALTKFMRNRVCLQSPPPQFSMITRNTLMRNTKLLAEQAQEEYLPEQQQLSEGITLQLPGPFNRIELLEQHLHAEEPPEQQQLRAQVQQAQTREPLVQPAQAQQAQTRELLVQPAQTQQAQTREPLVQPAQAQPVQTTEQLVQPLPLDALTFSAWTTLYSNLEYMFRVYIGASYERPLPIQAVGSNIDFRLNVGNFMFQVAADCVQNEGLVTDRRVVVMSTIFAMGVAAFVGLMVNAFKRNR